MYQEHWCNGAKMEPKWVEHASQINNNKTRSEQISNKYFSKITSGIFSLGHIFDQNLWKTVSTNHQQIEIEQVSTIMQKVAKRIQNGSQDQSQIDIQIDADKM